MSLHLSIVIPAWNEARRLPATLEKLAVFLEGQPFESEVLVVVEPGSDATLELARAFACAHRGFTAIANEVHRGKGFAVRAGMLRAQGTFVFYMDADLSVPLEEIGPFLGFFEEHPQVAAIVGNRAHARSRITRRQSVLRREMGRLFNRLLQALSLVALHDTQCGFKAFRRKAARAIFQRQTLDGFAFDVEVLLLAQAQGFSVADLPVEWLNSPESKVHIVRDSVRMFLDTLHLRFVRRLRG